MIIHQIPLESFIPHGKVTVSIENNELHMIGGIDYGAYIALPDKFKLPFRIDMTAKIDSPALILRIGDGYINLNTGGMDNRRMISIIGGETKPNIHKFDNMVPLNEYFDVSVIYGRKAMQLIINGEERYFNKKDIYMKSPSVDTDFKDGFEFKIACHKRTEVLIKSLTITEYDDEPDFPVLPREDFIYSPCLTSSEKPTLDDCIQELTQDLKDKIYDMDKYLRSLKFKRIVEGGYPESKITYILPKVISYKIKISHNLLTHWTMLLNGNYIGDFNSEILSKLAETDSGFADEIFFRMNDCTRCNGKGTGGPGCMNYNLIEYNGKKKINCAFTVKFKMIPSDFADVKKLINAVIALI